jgi:hypothetical protein
MQRQFPQEASAVIQSATHDERANVAAADRRGRFCSLPLSANPPPQGLVQPGLHFHRIVRQIRIAAQLDNELCLLNQIKAVLALLHVQLNFFYDRGFQVAIDIAGNARYYAFAVQFFFPFCRK